MYRELSEFHPWSAIGMEAPLAIARSYEQRGLTAEAMDAYQRAVGTYSTRIAEGPSAELVTRAKGYLALVHQRLGHWDRAIDLLEELAGSEGVNRPLVLLSLATIYQTKTGNAEKAGAVYGRLSQEFPEHVFGQVAKKQLERLQQPDMPEALSAPVTP
jgi:tetratricopeptide (TPR) repeat protein